MDIFWNCTLQVHLEFECHGLQVANFGNWCFVFNTVVQLALNTINAIIYQNNAKEWLCLYHADNKFNIV